MNTRACKNRAKARGFNIEPLFYLCCLLVVGAFLIGLGKAHRSFAVAGITVIILSPLLVWLILAFIGWFYSKRSRPNVEPDGPANGSQPIRSETNSTSSAAGSRR